MPELEIGLRARQILGQSQGAAVIGLANSLVNCLKLLLDTRAPKALFWRLTAADFAQRWRLA